MRATSSISSATAKAVEITAVPAAHDSTVPLSLLSEALRKNLDERAAVLRAEIDAKEVRIQVLRQQATPYNYDVVRSETELKGLRDKLANAEKQYDQTCAGDVCLTTAKVPAWQEAGGKTFEVVPNDSGPRVYTVEIRHQCCGTCLLILWSLFVTLLTPAISR